MECPKSPVMPEPATQDSLNPHLVSLPDNCQCGKSHNSDITISVNGRTTASLDTVVLTFDTMALRI